MRVRGSTPEGRAVQYSLRFQALDGMAALSNFAQIQQQIETKGMCDLLIVQYQDGEVVLGRCALEGLVDAETRRRFYSNFTPSFILLPS